MSAVAIVITAAVAMIVVERVKPGVQQPRVAGWWMRLGLLNLVQVGAVYLGASSWDQWLPQWRLIDARPLGTAAGAAIGYLCITFVFYWWHRARHEIPLLWRWLHQVHHSPVRIEVLTSFYKHPLEILINAVLLSSILYVLVGLDPATAAVVTAIAGVGELFYHWNLRTPHWLGYLFQRPEAHRRHHQRNYHRANYSDLPLWDLLFGTFDNPRQTPQHCGFADDAECALTHLLIGRMPQTGAMAGLPSSIDELDMEGSEFHAGARPRTARQRPPVSQPTSADANR
jgi:sterol desaturase/sphingolipid hydroxylase (fatty acid hydroxylase superfamily)